MTAPVAAVLSVDKPAAARAIEAFLRALGHAESDALRGTGERVASLFADELLDGYRSDSTTLDRLVGDAIAVEGLASLVVLEGLETHIVCPHHLTVARGKASIAYQPRERVLGLGAIAEIVDAFAHRLALQEDVGHDVARALVERLGAAGAACKLTMRHGCLELHGPKKRGARVTTLALEGCFASDATARNVATLALLGPGSQPRRGRE